MKNLDIAIIGYGTAGQAAALALGADGHRVQVFERAAEPGPVGAGFLLQPTGLAALWELGLLSQALDHGRRIERLFGDLPSGRGVMDMRYADLDPAWFGLGMQRGALFEILKAAWPLQGRLVVDADVARVDTMRGELVLVDGRRHGPFDLVVAADGSASRLRALLPEVRLDRPYPWGALWCLLAEGNWSWGSELRQRYRRAERMVGVLPVGTRPGDAEPRVSFFWSLPTAEFGNWRGGDFAAWKAELLALWPDTAALLEGLAAPKQLVNASYRDVILGRNWHQGKMVLIGDAAHAMSPQLGQGVNMALLDALALRDALREGGDTQGRLRDFADRRRRHVAIYQFWSRALTPVFQSNSAVLASLRDLALRPLGRLPGGRGNMLRVLTGTRQGLLGAVGLPEGFLRALQEIG